MSVTENHLKFIEFLEKTIDLHRGDPESDKQITKWLKSVGINDKTAPFCAAYVSYMVNEFQPVNTFKKSASALGLYRNNIDKKVDKPYTGCLFFWDFGNGTGHTGIVCNVNVPEFGRMITIEANTKKNKTESAGSERTGGWVAKRERSSVPGIYPTLGVHDKIKLIDCFIDPFL